MRNAATEKTTKSILNFLNHSQHSWCAEGVVQLICSRMNTCTIHLQNAYLLNTTHMPVFYSIEVITARRDGVALL